MLHTRLTPLGRIYIISIGAGFLPTRMQYQLKQSVTNLCSRVTMIRSKPPFQNLLFSSFLIVKIILLSFLSIIVLH